MRADTGINGREPSIPRVERALLRDLARRVRDISADPVMAERRLLWKEHNSLRRLRPMLLVFPEGAWIELIPRSALSCENAKALEIERELRKKIYYHEHFADDTVIEPEWRVEKVVESSGWGLETKVIPSSESRGASRFDPVLRDFDDFKNMRVPEIFYDEESTLGELEFVGNLFGDILDVRLRGVTYVAFALICQYSGYRGLDTMMLDMYDNPGFLHDVLEFLAGGHEKLIDQYCELNLLSLNNDGSYHASGGNGYTDELPADGFDPNRVRPIDLWASGEAQELAQVGPEQHEEFALKYDRKLLSRFGLNGYGCCEDLTLKLPYVFTLPRLRRISISPWADVKKCAEQIGGRYIFSWKPHPAHLVGGFSESTIRNYLREALQAFKIHGCVAEIILKDTHTCEHHPERFDRWLSIAREEIDRNRGV